MRKVVICGGILVLLVLCNCTFNADRFDGNTVGDPVGVTKEMPTVPQKVYSQTDKRDMPKVSKVPSREIRVKPYKVYTMISTAYSLNKNNTVSGLRPGPGRVAVDPSVIPLGTRLWIENYGAAVAADTGTAIKNMRVDVWFKSERTCKIWGVRTVEVKVYE